MGNLLNISEVVEFAVYIEKNGYKFYVETMKKFADKRLMELFQYLADEEFKHEGMFKKLLEKVGNFTKPESYPGEYEAYMKDFLKTHALSNDDVLKQKIESIKTKEDAVNVALDFEKDSIVLFSMLRGFIEDDKTQVVDIIIKEEIQHILKINQFLKGG